MHHLEVQALLTVVVDQVYVVVEGEEVDLVEEEQKHLAYWEVVVDVPKEPLPEIS